MTDLVEKLVMAGFGCMTANNRAVIERVLAAIEAEGFALTRTDPTPEMVAAGLTATVNKFGAALTIGDALDEANSTPGLMAVAYRAMIEAGRIREDGKP